MAEYREGGKTRRGPWAIVLAVSLVVLVVSATALGLIAYSYWQGQRGYAELASKFEVTDTADESGAQAAPSINWDALKAQNPDVVGWVRIPNTRVDYPIVQSSNNEYYLYHDFDGNEGWLATFGAIFLDYRNDASFDDDASFVYGHHLNDGSMFAAISEMEDRQRFEDCRTVYLSTPVQSLELRSFALVHCNEAEEIVKTEFSDEAERTAYFEEMISRSVHDPGAVPRAEEIDRAFAFATCDNSQQSSGRYVLFCYIIDTEE